MTLAATLLGGLTSGALTAAASRPWGLGFVALIAYVPVFVSILRSRLPSHGAAAAALAGLGVASVGYEATVGIFPGAYFAALFIAPLPYAVAGALAVLFQRSRVTRRFAVAWQGPLAGLALAVLWCAAEVVPARPELMGVWALPLSSIAYSQVGLPTAQLARLSSVSAVTFFVLLVNAGLAVLWRAQRNGRWPLLIPARLTASNASLLAAFAASVAVTAATSSVAIGTATIGNAAAGAAAPETVATIDASGEGAAHHSRPTLRVQLVQPNLPDSAYVAAAEVSAVEAGLVARLVALADENRGLEVPQLTLLPEASWPGVVRPTSAAAVVADLNSLGTVMFGAVAAGWQGEKPAGPRRANSVLLASDGELRHVYDKRRLVPIAEAPLRAGAGPALVNVGGLQVAPLICFDVVFPADVRSAARAGADLLAVFTDDSFASNGDVPVLHLRVAAMRAIETGLPVALVANTGPSAAISAAGETFALSRPLEATALTATFTAGDGNTPYVRFGDWVGASVVALSFGVGVVGVAGGGAREQGTGPT